MKGNDLLILGAITIGGYFLYTKLIKPAADVAGAVGGAASGIGDYLTTPMGPSGPNELPSFTPMELGFPPIGIPKAIDIAITPMGGKGTSTLPPGAFIFPPLGFPAAIKTIQAAKIPSSRVGLGDVFGIVAGLIPGQKAATPAKRTDFSYGGKREAALHLGGKVAPITKAIVTFSNIQNTQAQKFAQLLKLKRAQGAK